MTSPQDALESDTVATANRGDIVPAQTDSHASDPDSWLTSRFRQALRYLAIARPHHYGKNVLVVAGVILACIHRPGVFAAHTLFVVGWGLAATCLIASSNYVLNEILDARSDRFHRSKRDRPIAAGYISPMAAAGEWLILGAVGLSIAASIGWSFFIIAVLFQLMAIFYNVPPLRLKDFPYLDVLSEAVNSPLRLLLGWLIVLPSERPDIWLILIFWMAGAFEMARKRLMEFRFLRDPTVAAGYRKSFGHYDERRLKSSMAVYASMLAALGAIEAWKLWP